MEKCPSQQEFPSPRQPHPVFLVLLLPLVGCAAPASTPTTESAAAATAAPTPVPAPTPTLPPLPRRQSPADVSHGLVVMQGGGADVDENYVAIGGDFVVLRRRRRLQQVHLRPLRLRLGGDDRLRGAQGVRRTRRWWPRSATPRRSSSPAAASRYVRFWKGTPWTPHFVAAKPAPIGMRAPGWRSSRCRTREMTPDSLTSSAASPISCPPPFHLRARLPAGAVGLKVVITDQHLHERDRHGRTVTMLLGWCTLDEAGARRRLCRRETAFTSIPPRASERSTPRSTRRFHLHAHAPEVCEAGKPAHVPQRGGVPESARWFLRPRPLGRDWRGGRPTR